MSAIHAEISQAFRSVGASYAAGRGSAGMIRKTEILSK
jgi:hypothetical protein